MEGTVLLEADGEHIAARQHLEVPREGTVELDDAAPRERTRFGVDGEHGKGFVSAVRAVEFGGVLGELDRRRLREFGESLGRQLELLDRREVPILVTVARHVVLELEEEEGEASVRVERDVARTRPRGRGDEVAHERAGRRRVDLHAVRAEVDDADVLAVGRHARAVAVRTVLARLVRSGGILRDDPFKRLLLERAVRLEVHPARRAASVLGEDELLLVGRKRKVARRGMSGGERFEEHGRAAGRVERVDGHAAVRTLPRRGTINKGRVEARPRTVDGDVRGVRHGQRAAHGDCARLGVHLHDLQRVRLGAAARADIANLLRAAERGDRTRRKGGDKCQFFHAPILAHPCTEGKRKNAKKSGR